MENQESRTTRKTLAIIAEYNPLHEGHRYQFQQSLMQSGASHSLILMSGNFVQRGEPAITDKFERAEKAIGMGADLVLELPFIYAVNSAEYFAEGAVRILEASGVVDYLAFGSESGNVDRLKLMADRLLEPNHPREVKELMRQGLSYAQAVDRRLGHVSRQPNDILAIQYLRALKKVSSRIEPIAIPRIGAYHDDNLAVRYPSATAIRQAHRRGDLNDIRRPIYLDQLRDMIYGKLLLDPLSSIHGMSEGIEPALRQAALRTSTLEELMDSVRTPRFSLARLKRLFIHSLMNYQTSDQKAFQGVVYFRPLAFNAKGQDLLKQMKQRNPEIYIPNINRFQGDDLVQRALDFDIRSSNLYYHFQKTKPEQTRRPIIIK